MSGGTDQRGRAGDKCHGILHEFGQDARAAARRAIFEETLS